MRDASLMDVMCVELFVAFFVMDIAGVIAWPWWAVCMPLFMCAAVNVGAWVLAYEIAKRL